MKTLTHLEPALYWRFLLLLALAVLQTAQAADPVFSGPQPGEKITPFKTLLLAGPQAGSERDPVTEHKGAPTAYVFIHTVERSLVPLLRAIDAYGASRKERIKTEVVFLSGDRLAGEQRLKAAVNSLKLQATASLSLDGAEGPGNYGLNKECMMTIVAARENKVTANFALIQPGITDAPAVISALAKTCGDDTPPPIETLVDRPMARAGAPAADGPMRRNAEASDKPKENFPGAAPTDEKLAGLLRRFIRPTNDDATVDRVLAEVETYIKNNPDLTRQAVDGWTRVLHFGDRYGTPYARKVGAEFLAKLKRQ